MCLLPKAVEFVDALWRELIDSEKAVIKETTLLTVESSKINILVIHTFKIAKANNFFTYYFERGKEGCAKSL